MTAHTLIEIRDAIRSKALSSRAAVERMLDRIRDLDPKVKALISHDGDRAVALAKQADDQLARGQVTGPLHGVPVLIKDNMCTAFGRTTCASRILENFKAPYNAHVVEKLEAAGAIIVGKTNLDEFAMGSSTENSAFAATRNPWDLDRVPGGSSGGSAAVVAADIAAGSLGSDTGGSIRLPASFCGVTGLKPTYGRVSRYGLVAYGSSLDQIGPFGRTVRDCALLLGVISGKDHRDSTSVDKAVPDYLAALDRPLTDSAGSVKGRPLSSVRIGYAEEYFGEGLDPAVRSAVEAAIEAYKSAGATVQTLHLPNMKYAIACYYLIATAEASSNLARYDGVHYGHRTAAPKDYVDMYCASRQEGFGAEVRRRIMLGTYALSSGYYDAYYLKALKVRTLIQRDFEQAFAQVDVIACPTAPTPAIRIGEKANDPLSMYLMDIYTVSANLAGIPGISIPCGFSKTGLPIGLQLMGAHFAEDRLLRIAHEYQLRTQWHTRLPPIANGGV
jgi:aspartyl-tRNA(Asn)/glutamyl-tRNA(Gln) amidotransferase subunit A